MFQSLPEAADSRFSSRVGWGQEIGSLGKRSRMKTNCSPIDEAPELCRMSAAQLAVLYGKGALSPVDVAAQIERCVSAFFGGADARPIDQPPPL